MIPGFVDSHTHLVFGGDRAEEFAARMAGRRYEAGGIRSTVAATRAATDDELRARLAGFVAELHAQGTTTFEVKSGYGLSVADEERLVRLAREVTEEVTFLGAHVVPAEYADTRRVRAPTTTSTSSSARCSRRARRTRAGSTRSASAARSRPSSRAACSRPARAAGLGVRVHGNQLGQGGGRAASRSSSARHPSTTARTSATRMSPRSRHPTPSRPCCPGVEFSTRQPYPDARRLIDAGVTVALASDCNPGSSFTSSMPFCIAVAVRDMGMTPAEAVWASTAGGAVALRRTDVGALRPGARADFVLLDAPSHVHLAYRPGVPLVARVWKDGAAVA